MLVVSRRVNITDLNTSADLESWARVSIRFVFGKIVDIIKEVGPNTQRVGTSALSTEIVSWEESVYIIHVPEARDKYLYSLSQV